MTGIETRRTKTKLYAIRLHYSANPQRDAAWVAENKPMMPGWKWQKEEEIDPEARGGKRVYEMFDSGIHVRPTLDWEDEQKHWTLYRTIDHGRTHPCCCLWGGVARYGDLYIYREYHVADRTVLENVREMQKMSLLERYEATLGGHDMGKKLDNSHHSLVEEYVSSGLDIAVHKPNVETAVNRISQRLLSGLARWSLEHEGLHPYFADAGSEPWNTIKKLAMKPALYIHPSCEQTIRQLKNIRWAIIHRIDHDEIQEKPEVFDNDAHDALKNLADYVPDFVGTKKVSMYDQLMSKPLDGYRDLVPEKEEGRSWMSGNHDN